MEALQAATARRPPDSAGKLGPQLALVLVRAFEATAETRVIVDGARPALDASAGLQPRDRSDELRTREVVRGREWRTGGVARPLLGHGRPAEGAADGYAPEGARRATELSRNDGLILHAA